MAELVECARLEIAYSGNTIEGSNPPISAINKNTTQRVVFCLSEIYYGIRPSNEIAGFGTKQSEVKGTHEQSEWELQSPISAINKNTTQRVVFL